MPQETTTATDNTLDNIVNNENNTNVRNNDDILNELGIDINSIFNENTLNNADIDFAFPD